MTQPAQTFSPGSFPPTSEGQGDDPQVSCEADLWLSNYTYDFLKGVETVGPTRPKKIAIPKTTLSQMGNMERQYWEIKAPHFNVVLFFKKGKFYELYDADAVIASREFGLKMVCDTTNRGKMRMAGVPEQSFSEWARLFVYRGYKVGRVEQMSREDDDEATGSVKAKVVPRELVQILTPGTLTDDAMITGHHTHFVLAICPAFAQRCCTGAEPLSGVQPVLDAVAVDLSRGVALHCPCAGGADGAHVNEEVAALMHHLVPKEVLIPDSLALPLLLQNSCTHAETRAGDATSSFVALQATLDRLRRWLASDHHGALEVTEVDADVVLASQKAHTAEALVPAGQSAERLLRAYFHFLKLPSSAFASPEPFTSHLTNRGPAANDDDSKTAAPSRSLLTFERHNDSGVVLDAAAMDNLELVANLKDRTERHSLLAFLNRCVTNGGRRLMRAWVLRPSASAVVIRARQQAIADAIQTGLEEGWGAALVDEGPSATELGDVGATSMGKKRGRSDSSFRSMFAALFGVDFERSMSRLAELKRENPKVAYVDPMLTYSKHLNLILSTITGFHEMAMWATEALRHLSGQLPPAPPPRAQEGEDAQGQHHDHSSGAATGLLAELLQTMANVQPAVKHILTLFDKKRAEKTGTIVPNPGAVVEFDQAMSELQSLEELFDKELQTMKATVFRDTSVAYCDLGKDQFLVEVPLTVANKAKVSPSQFVERAKTTKSVKYVVVALGDAVERYKKATTARANALNSVLRAIAGHICHHIVTFHEAHHALAYLDCLMALASVRNDGAAWGATCVPEVVVNDDGTGACAGDEAFLEATALYHPLLATARGSAAVPNDVMLSSREGRLLVLTGPNMAGKSTLMRTVAINMLLAQLGGVVFGSKVRFAPVDRIFTRIGARDAAHRGQSTLLVELTEASEMLRSATHRSLCLVDELGRGTSTHDGYAIARATLSYLSGRHHHVDNGGADSNRCTTPLVIFSTHYHALALDVQHSDASSRSLQLGYMDFSLQAPRLSNDSNADVKEIVFLFRLVKGICTRSYGVEVAVKAGIHPSIVQLAQQKSRQLSRATIQHQSLELLKEFLATPVEYVAVSPHFASRSSSLAMLSEA